MLSAPFIYRNFGTFGLIIDLLGNYFSAFFLFGIENHYITFPQTSKGFSLHSIEDVNPWGIISHKETSGLIKF